MENQFAKRLAELRQGHGSTAREMSLKLGQNAGYISTIEKGRAYPTMTSFMEICDYLDVKPDEFFRYDLRYPEYLHPLTKKIGQLNQAQLQALNVILDSIVLDS